MIKIYGYSKCSTVKKSLKFLDENNIKYEHIDNVENPLTAAEIKKIHENSDLDIKKFFNTSGMKYRELGLKDKLPNFSLEECYAILATDGMLVKRPLLVSEKGIATGFNEKKWIEVLGI